MLKGTFRWTIIMSIAFWAFAVTAQQPKIALPKLAGAAVPLYPPLARQTRVQGVVHLKITTDGNGVATVDVLDGHKLLADAAKENALTWKFTLHEPATFTVTYRYKLDPKRRGDVDDPTVLLRYPTEIEISTAPAPPLDTVGYVPHKT